MSDSKPTLTLCMIARNAARSLGEALASAQPFVDEIVVVDTGSTDNTCEIARQHSARVFDLPWRDDFSAARNHSLEQATGDWILWLDADDVLPAASGRELRDQIEACPSRDAAFWAVVEEETRDRHGQPRVQGHAHVKVFPRHEKIRFRYRIHEQVAPAIRELQLPIKPTTAVIRHAHADRSAAGERDRNERNLRLALLDLAEHPGDPVVWLSVGTAYLFHPGGLPSAIDYLRRGVAGFARASQNQLNAYLYLGQALAASGERREEERLYREALALFPNDAVLLRRLARLCEMSGRLREAAACLETALTRGQTRRTAVHTRGGPASLVLRLGDLYVQLGQRARAERLWSDFLERHPEAAAVQSALSKSYLDSCSYLVGPSH